ncbi:MAG TPA: hypothetical protein VKG23_04360 [Thermoanaerobaculia bacterium]|nr:hypothetical protein [Thermoanaerobaculia bacterium]
MTRSRRLVFAAGFLAALAVRVVYLAHVSTNPDVAVFADVVAILRRGGDLYVETNRYNYSPLWAYVLVALDGAARLLGCSLALAIGGFLTAADAATAALLHRLAGGGRRGAAAALLFFANPVSVFGSCFHLQFDDVAILFLVLALVSAAAVPASRARTVVALSASLVVKHVTVFFPPLFLERRSRRGLRPVEVLIPYAAFAAVFLPYARTWAAVRRNVFGYRGLAEDYGTAMLRKIPGAPDWLPMAVFLAAVAAAIVFLIRRDVEPARACLLLFLVMLLTIPGIVEYYFVWPIALGALFGGAGYAVYTLTVSAFFLGSPDGLNLPLTHLPGWHGVWWSVLLWLAWELRRLPARPAVSPGIMAA